MRNPKDAVAQADILVTCAFGRRDLYESDGGVVQKGWLKKGCTIAAVDILQYFYQDVLNTEIDYYTTDDSDQFQFISERAMYKTIPFSPVEMSQIILGKEKGRESRDQTIFCANVGLGLADVILAYKVYERATEKGIGIMLKR